MVKKIILDDLGEVTVLELSQMILKSKVFTLDEQHAKDAKKHYFGHIAIINIEDDTDIEKITQSSDLEKVDLIISGDSRQLQFFIEYLQGIQEELANIEEGEMMHRMISKDSNNIVN